MTVVEVGAFSAIIPDKVGICPFASKLAELSPDPVIRRISLFITPEVAFMFVAFDRMSVLRYPDAVEYTPDTDNISVFK